MAYHGGALEEMTDVIAREVAARTGASYYGVHQPTACGCTWPRRASVPSSPRSWQRSSSHVRTVMTVHGFGRRGHFTSLLLGGRNRELAEHVGAHLRERLPAYDVITDLDRHPGRAARHARTTTRSTCPPTTGVQLELPPRVRGSSPLWWDWEHGLTPHTEALIAALAEAAAGWSD
jgi:phage replication-related protein YjqB (UPF0714/DUF867 family)